MQRALVQVQVLQQKLRGLEEEVAGAKVVQRTAEGAAIDLQRDVDGLRNAALRQQADNAAVLSSMQVRHEEALAAQQLRSDAELAATRESLADRSALTKHCRSHTSRRQLIESTEDVTASHHF